MDKKIRLQQSLQLEYEDWKSLEQSRAYAADQKGISILKKGGKKRKDKITNLGNNLSKPHTV